MTIEFDDVTDVLRRVRLTGRLDVPGTQAISIKFGAINLSIQTRGGRPDGNYLFGLSRNS